MEFFTEGKRASACNTVKICARESRRREEVTRGDCHIILDENWFNLLKNSNKEKNCFPFLSKFSFTNHFFIDVAVSINPTVLMTDLTSCYGRTVANF